MQERFRESKLEISWISAFGYYIGLVSVNKIGNGISAWRSKSLAADKLQILVDSEWIKGVL